MPPPNVRYPAGEPMSTEITRRLFSVHDYARMAEVGILGNDDRIELIRGEILRMTPIGPRHNAAVNRAARELNRTVDNDAIVWIQSAVQLDNWNAPEPDIALLEPRDDFYASSLPRPEDIVLVIEIAESSLNFDRTTKAALYADAGIGEYWIADLDGQQLLALSEPNDGRYVRSRIFSRHDQTSPMRLPGCTVRVRDLVA
jgi:Uma2 family endonuclease